MASWWRGERKGTLTSLRASLSGCDGEVFIRAAALSVEGGRHAVWYVDAIVAPPSEPPRWEPLVWKYDAVTFIASRTSCNALAAALDRDDAQMLPVGGYDLTLPVLSEQLPWQHKPSRARYDSVVLPWPTLIFEPWIENRSEGQQRSSGYMIGDDCPVPSYEAAFRAFYTVTSHAHQVARCLQDSAPSVLSIAGHGWRGYASLLPHFRFASAVATSSAPGWSLIARPTVCRRRANATGEVRLPLSDGLSPGAWLYLSRDRQWLDYRAIGEYAAADLARAGVDVEVPDDPESEIEALLSQGEGLQIEFKRQLPGDSADSKRTVFKTIAAFANGHGGSIVFGVEKDEATVCGLDEAEFITARDRLTQIAARP